MSHEEPIQITEEIQTETVQTDSERRAALAQLSNEVWGRMVDSALRDAKPSL